MQTKVVAGDITQIEGDAVVVNLFERVEQPGRATAAEGRLMLADASSCAVKQGPSPSTDLATSTGACRVALGLFYAGASGNDQSLADKVLRTAEKTGGKMWQMPMPEEHEHHNNSEIGDMKNAGNRCGGAVTAGLFLAESVGNTPWGHLDIAGPRLSTKEIGHVVKGATGFGVTALAELASSEAKSQEAV